MKNQNGDINVLKFAFAIGILLVHFGMEFQCSTWLGSWIGVEWFLVFAGYTMTKQIYEKPQTRSLGTETAGFVIRRIGAFFPYLLVTAVVALVLMLGAGATHIDSLRDGMDFLFDPLTLQIFGFRGTYFVGITWYLGALWGSMALLYPVVRKFRGTFDRVYAFLIPIFIYGYYDHVTGYLWDTDAWLGLCMKGFPRAIAAICLGAVSYNIGLYLKSRFEINKKWEWATLAVYACIFVLMYKWDDSKIYYLIPFVFAVLLAVNMTTGETVCPDNKLTRFLGKASMMIFLAHSCVLRVQQVFFPVEGKAALLLVTFVGTALVGAVAWVLGDRLKPVWNWLFRGL